MKDAQGEWIVISEADATGLIDYLNPQSKLPAKILYHYGLRVSEVLGLTSEHFREEYTVLVLQRLKKGLNTRQYILPELRTQIMEIASKRAPSGVVKSFCCNATLPLTVMRTGKRRARGRPTG